MALKEYTNPVGVYNNNYSSGLTTAHIDNTANVYTEEFKAFLQQVQASYPTTVRQIPLDEPRIQVNLNTRIIDIENSEYADFLTMTEDHRSTTIYFEVDRYFEDVDLFNCTCIVEYINGGGHPRIYPITLKDLIKQQDENGRIVDKMLLAWNIGSEATLYKGDIQFCITFYKVSYELADNGQIINCELIYALHTVPATGYIMHGMEYDEKQEIEKTDCYTIADHSYQTLLDILRQKNVYWNDV